jgi:hypothetical protein
VRTGPITPAVGGDGPRRLSDYAQRILRLVDSRLRHVSHDGRGGSRWDGGGVTNGASEGVVETDREFPRRCSASAGSVRVFLRRRALHWMEFPAPAGLSEVAHQDVSRTVASQLRVRPVPIGDRRTFG